jgi:hypothetical protein
VGIDWADQKHVWSLQVTATGKREHGEVGHSPEEVEEWTSGLMARFPGHRLAVALEQSRGALLNMLSKYQQLVLFPVHPATISRLRAALYPSGAKDDPKDANLVLDMLVYHRERLRPLEPDTLETRQLRFFVEQRRGFVDQRTAQSNRLKSALKQYYPQVLEWFDGKRQTNGCSDAYQQTYDHAINDFVEWYCPEPRLAFNRTVILRYRTYLEQKGYAPNTINLRHAAVRRVAYEAADSAC